MYYTHWEYVQYVKYSHISNGRRVVEQFGFWLNYILISVHGTVYYVCVRLYLVNYNYILV